MRDKDKLKKFVEIIGDLLKIEGNEWLVNEVLNTIGEAYPIEEMAKHSIIQNINEYCIEQIIEKQAKDFYSAFPITEIKDQLIQDYKKMEHERRRDDFEGFSLCMFQQIEAINNFLFKSHIQPEWDNIKNIQILKYNDKITGKQVTKSLKQETLGNSTNWGVFAKYKAVSYYFYFNKKNPLPFSYMKKKEDFYEIYQIRNKNHREGVLLEFQKNILERINGNESKYYFKFYGFLQDFVNKIEDSFTNNHLKKMVKTQSKSNNPKNTIGDYAPELRKLKEELEKNQ